MKKFKKSMAGFLSVTILSLSAVTAFAANTEDFKIVNDMGQITEIKAVNDRLNGVEQSYFNSFTGKVKKITDSESVKGSKFILVENEEGVEANIIISANTYIINNADIAVGSVVTGFYEANAPMIMIYPAQYNAEVVMADNQDQNVKVDVFNKDLVSEDNSLKLNISDDTEIILQDGKAFEGDLANRKLVVLYDVSTKSIPAQTNPSKIVVLFEKAVAPIYNLTPEETAALTGNVSTLDIVVNNKKIEAPSAYANDQGTVMVPLRAIAEALGYDVTWNGDIQSVTVGNGISLTIGKDNYIYMKTAPIQLGTAPTVINEKTFVPLSFFQEVARVSNAQVSQSQITIDNIVIDDGEMKK